MVRGFRIAALTAALSLFVGATATLAAPTPDDPKPMLDAIKNSPQAKLGPWLSNLYAEYQQEAVKGVTAKAFKSKNNALRSAKGLVGIDAYANDAAALTRSLRVLGATKVKARGPLVSARVPVKALGQIAALTSLRSARPVLATVDGYRQNHLAHHQHTNTEKDPDWIAKLGTAAYTFPQKVWHAALQLLGYLVAVNSFRDMAQILPRISKNDRSTLQYKLLRLVFYAGWAALFTVLGIWRGALLYWIVPFFTLFFMFVYIRGVAEHGLPDRGGQADGARRGARSRVGPAPAA
jgi:hypothetical protein